MRYHPHFHYIVPAVRLTESDKLKHLKDPKLLILCQVIGQTPAHLLRAQIGVFLFQSREPFFHLSRCHDGTYP